MQYHRCFKSLDQSETHQQSSFVRTRTRHFRIQSACHQRICLLPFMAFFADFWLKIYDFRYFLGRQLIPGGRIGLRNAYHTRTTPDFPSIQGERRRFHFRNDTCFSKFWNEGMPKWEQRLTVGAIIFESLVFVDFSAYGASIFKISFTIFKRRSWGFQNTPN